MDTDFDSLTQDVETNEDILKIKREIFKVDQDIANLAKDAKKTNR